MTEQNRAEELRRHYSASIKHGGLDTASPNNDAADDVALIRDAAAGLAKAITSMGAQARIEIVRVDGEIKFNEIADEVRQLATASTVALYDLNPKRSRKRRSPNIARNVFLRGLHQVWIDEQGDGPLQYTSATKDNEAYGPLIDFLKTSVSGLAGFENDSGDSLLKAFQRAIKAGDR
jgi:hypothetical protein